MAACVAVVTCAPEHHVPPHRGPGGGAQPHRGDQGDAELAGDGQLPQALQQVVGLSCPLHLDINQTLYII